jgi:hypothetical protein
MQLYSMNLGKFTSNTSNTGKSTSETNQIRFVGGHGGGLPPSTRAPGTIETIETWDY